MDTPQVLLEHYLKQLRLPTMVREYRKLGEQCAKEPLAENAASTGMSTLRSTFVNMPQ
jgi:hypothetical protein